MVTRKKFFKQFPHYWNLQVTKKALQLFGVKLINLQLIKKFLTLILYIYPWFLRITKFHFPVYMFFLKHIPSNLHPATSLISFPVITLVPETLLKNNIEPSIVIALVSVPTKEFKVIAEAIKKDLILCFTKNTVQ